MNTLEQIVSSHPCPIIRAKIMENVSTYLTSVEKYNLKSIVVYGIEDWRTTKEGYSFWNAVDDNYTATYNDLKHLDKSYVPEPIPPTPKWLPIDRDNIPDEPVLAGNLNKKQIVVNRITINHLDGTIQSHNRREYFEVTHYIPLSDLLNLPIAE